MNNLKEIHDRWLEKKPEGAKHDEDSCTLCQAIEASQHGGTMTETNTGLTEEAVKARIDAAVAEATKPLQDKIAEHEGSRFESEVEAKIAAAVAEAEAKTEEVQKALDAAVLEAESAKTERDAITAWLEEEKTKVEKEAELASLRTERTAKVAEVAAFPEEYVKANTDRWAAMEEAAFTALLEDYKTVGVKPGGKGIPTHTALSASREETDKGRDAIREVMNFRADGIDPRHI